MHSMNFHTSFSTSKSSRPVQPTHAPLYLITTGATAVTNPPALEESREVGVNIFVTSSLINVLILFSISEQSLFYLAFLKRLPSSACRFRTKGRRLETTMMGASCSEESSPSLPPASEYAPLNRGSRAASRAHTVISAMPASSELHPPRYLYVAHLARSRRRRRRCWPARRASSWAA